MHYTIEEESQVLESLSQLEAIALSLAELERIIREVHGVNITLAGNEIQIMILDDEGQELDVFWGDCLKDAIDDAVASEEE